MINRTNIAKELQRVRETALAEVSLDQWLEALLNPHPGSGGPLPVNQFEFDLLDTSRIYHLDQIRKICIDYRLRFLDLAYFKPEVPEEARKAVSELERTHQTQLEGLKIIAPSRLFKLEDKDDPLLFAPMGNGYFYLIHQWGNDLHPLRRWMVWPFKSLVNLTLLVVVLSYFLTLLVPEGLFSRSNSSAEFWIIFFFMFKSLAAVTIFYGFALGKNFNPAIWNSKYFNA
ncbi:hypothetical protein [Robiginitalea marina]|uniref:Uncharacterized protein n=1 Tax=Robiginitalea marina TaxID=2954105 RepID=A0ABT1AVU8_9FLAO|nr:hypothetical protein [Robiginitalea marina]MCO5723695.1 hypothetical protein [Robiginitalea marina]